jgi:hypothetical protein
MRYVHCIRGARIALLVVMGSLSAQLAHAVPSFARQTGMACEACHTVYPELNHFGRMFKANGYTLDNLKQVRGITATKDEMLALSGLPPISAMVQVSETQLSKPLPDSTDNIGHSQSGTVDFPQQISLFYAGKIAPHIGAFIQLTYGNDSGTIGIDNTDLRYANMIVVGNDQSLVYGVTANNNPTVQDLWNSTPAFGFPYASTNAGVSPLAATAIDGTFAQDVAGVSAYAMWNEALYLELGAYRSAKQGSSNTNPITGAAGPLDGAASNVISGTTPYFRVAYEHQWDGHSLEAGIYGATFKLFPGGGSSAAPVLLSGPVNKFQDVAEDFQYQFIGDEHLFSLNGTRIHESMTLDASFANGASANPSNDLTTVRFNATYYFRRKFGGTIGHFATTGSADAELYSAGAAPGVITSVNGVPDTKGWIAELNYLPWLNTKLSLQFTHYTEFNGGDTNYDGFGRNASDNNTTYLLLWVAF